MDGLCPLAPDAWADAEMVAGCERVCSNTTECVGFTQYAAGETGAPLLLLPNRLGGLKAGMHGGGMRKVLRKAAGRGVRRRGDRGDHPGPVADRGVPGDKPLGPGADLRLRDF